MIFNSSSYSLILKIQFIRAIRSLDWVFYLSENVLKNIHENDDALDKYSFI